MDIKKGEEGKFYPKEYFENSKDWYKTEEGGFHHKTKTILITKNMIKYLGKDFVLEEEPFCDSFTVAGNSFFWNFAMVEKKKDFCLKKGDKVLLFNEKELEKKEIFQETEYGDLRVESSLITSSMRDFLSSVVTVKRIEGDSFTIKEHPNFYYPKSVIKEKLGNINIKVVDEFLIDFLKIGGLSIVFVVFFIILKCSN